MLRRTEKMPSKASGDDLPKTDIESYLREMMFKLDVKYIESGKSTPKEKQEEEPPRMKL